MVRAIMETNIKNVAINAAAILSLSVLFTFFAVYDSDKLSFADRFLFWGSTIGVGVAVATFVGPWVRTQLLPKYSAALQLIVISALVSLTIPPILFWFDTGFKEAWPIANWGLQYFLAYVIVILVLTGDYIVRMAFKPSEMPVAAGDQGKTSIQKFLKRLPTTYQDAKLYAISSEDHYLRIHTDRGDELILMRLADAIHELEASDGIQTHRSWWVARDGVAEKKGKNGKQSLLLKCGTEVPISRARAKKTREYFLSSAT